MDRSDEVLGPAYSEDDDPAVPRQVFPSRPDPYFADLRTWFEFDSRIPKARSELERARAICASVHGRWSHSNDDEPSQNDPITILKEASKGKRFRCVQFGITLAGALTAFEIPARVVSMMSRDVETRESNASHVVTEAWLSSLGKWVMFDAQENALIFRGDLPLSCAEVAMHIRDSDLKAEIPGLPPGIDSRMYLHPQAFGANFYYFQTRVDQRRSEPNQVANERDHPSIVLCPNGAPEPRVFQRLFPLQRATYTRSRSAFYRAPE